MVLSFCGGAIQAQNPALVPNDLISWYRAENNALDVRGANNGSLQNGATFTNEKVGRAFSFDGSDDFVQTTSSGIFKNQSGATLEAWVRPKGIHGDGNGLIFFEDTGVVNTTRFGVAVLNNGSVRVIGRDANTGNAGAAKFVDTAVGTVPLNAWSHVAGVWQASVGLKIYVNGVLVSSLNDASVTNFTSDNAQVVRIGAAGVTNLTTDEFNGDIDELSLYSRALSASEIQAVFNAGIVGKHLSVPAPVGLREWWTADGNALGVRNRSNGTLQNGASYATNGKVGQAFSLDGFDDYVSVPHNSAQDIRQAITIESWIMKKGDCPGYGAGGNCVVLAKQIASGSTDANLRYGLLIVDSGAGNQGKFLLSFNTGTWDDIVLSNTIVQNDVWYHVAGTYDGSTAKIYVNGVLETSAAKTGEILPSTGGTL